MGCGNSKGAQSTAVATTKQNDIRTRQPTKFTLAQAEIIGNNIPVEYIQEGGLKRMDSMDGTPKTRGSISGFDQAPNGKGAAAVQPANTREVKNKIRNKIMEADTVTDTEVLTENVKRDPTKKMSMATQRNIQDALKNHFFFGRLSPMEIDSIIMLMFCCTAESGQYVFREGDQAKTFFFIEIGILDVEIQHVVKKKLKAGETFGQLALLYNATRSASILANEKCLFWAIDRRSFKHTIADLVTQEYETNRVFMERVSFFTIMTTEQKNAIANNLISVKYPKGSYIVNQGDHADSFYMIKEGKVAVEKDGKKLINLVQGDSFGETALYMKSLRLASVKAEIDTVCLSLGRDDLSQILGDKIQQIIFENHMRWAYDQSNLLNKITQIQQEKLLRIAQISNAKAGEIIFLKDEKPDQYVIVLEGEIKYLSKETAICGKGTLFGEEFLPFEKQQIPMSDSVVAKSNCVIATISFRHFHKAIGGDLQSVLEQNVNSHEFKMAKIQARKDYSAIKLENLVFIKKLGSGQFGNVFLVQDQSDKANYALKSVNKAMVVSQQLEKYLITEKRILEVLNFPFIMPFYRTFRDDISLYFLVECISGMELFDVIRDIGLLSTSDSQFYIGTIILCLEYLHNISIVYRDLKPDNIMVASDGIMYMIDMGTAKNLSQSKTPGRSMTIIGTPHYMAPEIMKQKGYSYSIDLWSVGVCLYEFMCGQMPYGEEASDPFAIYEEILNNSLQFPSHYKDQKGKKLIEQLLNMIPEKRLGGSYAALKANAWFDHFDWDKLYNKELKPPFLPPAKQVISQTDIDNLAQNGKPIIDEIQQEIAAGEQIPYQQPTDPKWDEQF